LYGHLNVDLSMLKAITQLDSVRGALIDGNNVTRCAGGVDGTDAFGVWQVGGGDNNIVVGTANTITNISSARLCAKRPQLVKVEGEPAVYFTSYKFEASVEVYGPRV
jgi:hypothetical protein